MSLSRPHGTILSDPYRALPIADRQTVSGFIDPTVHDELFRKMFPGCRGLANALVTIFIDSVYKECLAEGIPLQFEPENEQRLSDIISRLNFRPSRPGRSDPSPTTTPRQPDGQGHDAGPASRPHIAD